ncbi:MAG: endolytic transglycosylase MltG [Aggregatilineales bacterium]
MGLAILLPALLAWVVIGALALIDTTRPEPVVPTVLPTLPGTQIAFVPTGAASSTPTVLATNTPSQTPFVSLPTKSPTATPITVPTTAAPPLPSNSALTVAPTAPTTSVTGTPSSGCSPPDGWAAYSVTPGDTLFGFVLGSQGKLTVDAIVQANCLTSKLLTLGQVIYLPPGVAQNAPKIDDSSGGGTLLPAGLTRHANCPCTVVVRSGWRLEQIAAEIDKVPVGFTGRDFLAVTSGSAPIDGFGFLSGKPAGASLNGFIFPGTYTLDNSTTAMAFRNQTLRAFDAAVPAQWRSDAATHGLTFYQTITLASIVQRESYASVEQVKIASVEYNRMAAGKALASTPTVQYAVGRPGAWWPRVTGTDLANHSRYNTYIWLGVTPTPISNPDLSAIQATIYPAKTDYQYFSGNCDAPGNFYATTWEIFDAMLKHCGQG